jgi:hypothetical protein
MSGDSSPAQTMSAYTTKTIEEAIVIIGDAGIGKDLFEGRYQFSAKGVACLACHGVDLYDAEDGWAVLSAVELPPKGRVALTLEL